MNTLLYFIFGIVSIYSAVTHYEILQQQTNTYAVMLLIMVGVIFLIAGLINLIRKNRNVNQKTEQGGSFEGGFLSFMNFDSDTHANDGCHSGSDTDCGHGGD